MDAKTIELIADMLDDGMSFDEIAAAINEAEADEEGRIDGLIAAEYDDSDEGISRRHQISEDDDYDSRGRRLRPRINDAGEPWWM